MRFRGLRGKWRNRKIFPPRRAKTSATRQATRTDFGSPISFFSLSGETHESTFVRGKFTPLGEDGRPNHQFIITRRVRRRLSEYYAALWSSAMFHDGNNSRPEGKREDASAVTASFVRSSVRRETSFSVISPAGCPLAVRLCLPL